jgi:hypothetical protein
MLSAYGDYEAARGLKHKPEDLELKRDQGFIGYKIWYGPYYRTLKEGEKGFPYVDDPANECMFARMHKSIISVFCCPHFPTSMLISQQPFNISTW